MSIKLIPLYLEVENGHVGLGRQGDGGDRSHIVAHRMTDLKMEILTISRVAILELVVMFIMQFL